MKRIFSVVLAALILTGCGNTSVDPKETEDKAVDTIETTEGETVESVPETSGAEYAPDGSAAKSAHYCINYAMMNYFFRITYEQYASMAIYYGLDTGTSFKEQPCLMTDGGTWFDFFMDETVLYLKDVLSLCEAAKEMGISLEEAERKKIDAKTDDLRMQAASYGCNLSQLLYILFGCDMSEEDFRRCLEITLLADKVTAQFEGSYDHLTAEDYEAYYREYAKEFDSVDIMSFMVANEDFSDLEEDQVKAAVQGWVDRLMSAEDDDAFAAAAEEYMRTVLEMEDEDVEAMLSDLLVKGARIYNIADEELADWAFSGIKGDSKAFTYDETYYDVLRLASDAYRNESDTRNICHILFAAENYKTDEEAKAAAESAYIEWEASGFDAAVFAQLYEQFSSDASASNLGGVYKNVAQGAWVEEIDTWLFDSERVLGDHALIETLYGWHIVAYAGDSPLTAWQADVHAAIVSDAYYEMLEQYAQTVEFDDEVLNEVEA